MAPVEFLERAALAAVLSEAERAGLDVEFVLIGGSFAEGLASSTSDIDLVLVHSEARPRDALVLRVEGKRVEVTVFSLEDYRRTTTLDRQRDTGATAYWHLDARRRLLFSRPVYGHSQHATQLDKARLSEFGEDLLEYQQVLAFKSFSDLKSGLSDSMIEDDLRVRCRTHLERSVDLLLTSLRDYYFREKWRVARTRRTLTDDRLQLLVDPISAMLSGRPMPWGAEFASWTRMSFLCSTICQYVTAFSGSWPGCLTRADISVLLSELRQQIPVGVSRQGAAYFCQTPTKAFQLTPSLANAVTLSAIGLPLERVMQGVEDHARWEVTQGRSARASDAVRERLPGLLQRLGIAADNAQGSD
ncbi:MAG: nucleotidyltransferase domain-containing protein [Burkholderiaceae bacterium]